MTFKDNFDDEEEKLLFFKKEVWAKDALHLIMNKEVANKPKRSGNEFVMELAILSSGLLWKAMKTLPPEVPREEVLKEFFQEIVNKLNEFEGLQLK